MARIRTAADASSWVHLSQIQKAALYVTWANDTAIGGVLRGFMAPGELHRYLKDTLLKNYAIEKMADPTTALSILGISASKPVQKRFIKPHGLTFDDGAVVAWASAEQWKSTIMAVFERARNGRRLSPYAVVLFNAEGRFADGALRATADDAAKRLGLEKVVWTP